MVPLGLTTWLGVKVGRDEQEMVRHRLDDLWRSRLHVVADSIDALMKTHEQTLLELTTLSRIDADTIRTATRGHRLARQIFVINPKGQLVHPPKDDTTSQLEQAFFTRTQRLFSSKDPFFRPLDRPSQSGGQNGASRNPAQSYGWHVWYWEEGINLIFFRRDDQGRIIGVELSRIVLLADIVGALPATRAISPDLPERSIQLVDASGRRVYGYGPVNPQRETVPRVSIPLNPPLGSWTLQYFETGDSLDETLASSTRFNLLISLLALGLVLTGLAVYIFLESSRETRRAKKRVTFVNQVSHELKTPLTNIRMYAELLEDQIDDEEEKARGYLEVIVSESQRLSRLIANVLSFSRQQKGRQSVVLTTAVVDDVTRGVLAQFRPSFKAKGIEIVFHPNAAQSCLLDKDILGQILSNLLSNVEKYAAYSKHVTIHSSQAGHNTIITVKDEGPGIPRAARKKIFEPFFRIKQGLNEGVSGTGIGLAISRDLARLHSGDLTLESSDVGTCFKIVLHTPKKGSAS